MRDTLHTLQLQTRAKRARLESTRAYQKTIENVSHVQLIRTLLQVQIAVMIAGATQVTNTPMWIVHSLSVKFVQSVNTNHLLTELSAIHALLLKPRKI